MKFKTLALQILVPVAAASIVFVGSTAAQQPQKPADDLATQQLRLSSVLFVAQVPGNSSSKEPSVQYIVERRFPQSSALNYWMFVYNAKRDPAGAPDLVVKSEVWRNGQLITAAPARTIKNGSPDPDRIPFAEQIPLANLARGRYELVVTITDNVGAKSATQTIDFEVS